MGIEALDFPQMWERPSYAQLADILQTLELSPPIWNHKRRRSEIIEEQESLASQRKAEVTRYLSSIIKSPLSWIEDDDEKEVLWTQASKRMSERCGRTAMGEVIRSWPFEDGTDEFELIIREPALTGDSLGFKTWGSSYVLSQHLPRMAETSLFRLFDETLGQPKPDVLELGSGTGLLGLAAAAYWKVPVALSDLPNIVPNLRENVAKNTELVKSRGGSLTVGDLTWGGSEDEIDQTLFGQPHLFKIVLAADPMYDDDHPALLASAISEHLALGSDSRAVVMVPRRDATTERLLESFRQAMLDLDTPLFCEEEDELAGQDDWIEDDEAGNVRCWLGIFSRGGSPLPAEQGNVLTMTGKPVYKPEEIRFALDLMVQDLFNEEISHAFRERFDRELTDNQIRYLRNKYGKDPDYGSPLINRPANKKAKRRRAALAAASVASPTSDRSSPGPSKRTRRELSSSSAGPSLSPPTQPTGLSQIPPLKLEDDDSSLFSAALQLPVTGPQSQFSNIHSPPGNSYVLSPTQDDFTAGPSGNTWETQPRTTFTTNFTPINTQFGQHDNRPLGQGISEASDTVLSPRPLQLPQVQSLHGHSSTQQPAFNPFVNLTLPVTSPQQTVGVQSGA
ncbi:Protein-lysine N-methyltransferase rrg1 [Fusarium chlamydosporum]